MLALFPYKHKIVDPHNSIRKTKRLRYQITTDSAYEIRVERADNDLINLKRGTERAPRSS